MSQVLPIITPGEILVEEFLTPNGISQNRLGRDLAIPAQRVNDIVRGRRAITTDTALRLAEYFGTTPEFWLNLQVQYDIRKARAEKVTERIHREVRPLELSTARKVTG